MDDEITIRPLEERDRPSAVELLKVTMGHGSVPRTSEYWSWKHERSPFGPSAGLVAESAGQVVGLRVFMRWCWDYGGSRIQAVRAVDTATHPDWQGRGIFSRLTRALLEQVKDEGVVVVYNTPNRSSRPGYLKMGWVSVGRLTLWVYPMLGALTALIRRMQKRPSEAHQQAPASDKTVALFLASEVVQKIEEAPSLNGRSLRTPIGKKYLSWRYAEVPGYQYRAIWEKKGGVAAGLVYRVVERESLRELRICQIVHSSSDGVTRIISDLLRRALDEERADYSVSMSTTSGESRALFRAGFVPAPKAGPILTARRLDNLSAVDVDSLSAWRLSIGDVELF